MQNNKRRSQIFSASDPGLKSYYCPNCKKIIMKGRVKNLRMACPHCQELIDADEDMLLGAVMFENNQ